MASPVEHMRRLEESDPHHEEVNEPTHYTMGISVFNFIQSWEMNFAEGNVIKYLTRAPHKNNPVKDLKKARWYLTKLIKAAEDLEATPNTVNLQMEFNYD